MTESLPLWMAEKAASRVVELLTPACERIQIAGSIRRQQDVVGDIEIVAVPKLETATPPREMFPRTVNRLLELTDEIQAGRHISAGIIKPTVRPGTRKTPWGEKWRAIAVSHRRGAWTMVDLFIAHRKTFGPLLALRTGPADFSRALVTARAEGGLMPPGMRQHDGTLEVRTDRTKGEADPDAWEQLYLPDEADFFQQLGIPFIEPRERNERTLRRLTGRLV